MSVGMFYKKSYKEYINDCCYMKGRLSFGDDNIAVIRVPKSSLEISGRKKPSKYIELINSIAKHLETNDCYTYFAQDNKALTIYRRLHELSRSLGYRFFFYTDKEKNAVHVFKYRFNRATIKNKMVNAWPTP